MSDAIHGTGTARNIAMERLLRRYSLAIRYYLRALVQDPHEEDELFQTFALNFLAGRFQNADPKYGSFRKYLKTALARLVINAKRRDVRRRFDPQEHLDTEPALQQPDLFLQAWKKDLLKRAWIGLETLERQSGKPLYRILQRRSVDPTLGSEQLASQLRDEGYACSNTMWVRKLTREARTEFCNRLLGEVIETLGEFPTRHEVEAELADLEWLSFLECAMERRWS